MGIGKQSVLVLLILLLASGGWFVWHPGGSAVRNSLGFAEASEAAGGAGGRPGFGFGGGTLVVTEVVGSAIINNQLTAIGDGAALRSVALNPEGTGRIAAVLRTSGDPVKQGDVIARLESSAERIALDRALLAQRDAKKQLDRLTQIQKSNSVSEVALAEAESMLEASRLQVREATLALERRTISAPFSGVLGLVSLEPGTLVTPQNTVARLDDRTDLLINFRVPERFVGVMTQGLSVEVRPISNQSLTLIGTLSAVDNQVEPDSRTLRVQALIDNEDDSLRPGMSFVLDLRFPGEVFPTVNPLAIQWRSEGAYVWRIDADNNAERVPVRVIQRNSDAVLVSGDLTLGDEIVTEGVQSVRPGAAIRRANEPTANTNNTNRPDS